MALAGIRRRVVHIKAIKKDDLMRLVMGLSLKYATTPPTCASKLEPRHGNPPLEATQGQRDGFSS
jgi:hypothetical protein